MTFEEILHAMKNVFKIIVPLFAATSILMLSQCTPKPNTSEETQKTAADTLKKGTDFALLPIDENKNVIGNPISFQHYQALKDLTKQTYSTGQTAYSLVESIVPLADFVQYTQTAEGTFNCIRFYPAYKNNKIYMTICQTEDLPNGNDRSFIELDKELFPEGTFISSNTIPGSSYNAFLTSVQLNDNSQVGTRPSRAYPITDLNRLIVDNSSLNLKYIKFEIGYVPAALADEFTTRHNQNNPNSQVNAQDMKGFTVLITLIDANGNRLLDPINENPNPNNYFQKALEVGTPCPPRCGALQSSAKKK